jgi:hypothetical protein
MRLLTCAAKGCTETFEFDPVNPLKKFHSLQCGIRTRVARKRKRDKLGGGDDGGGRQRRLLPKPLMVKAKPVRRVEAPQPTLFERERDLLVSLGGAEEYLEDGTQRPIRDIM